MSGSVTLGGFLLFFLQSISKDENNKVKKLVAETEENNKEYQKKGEDVKISFEKIEKTQEEERMRYWATKGLAEIATLMRSENDLNLLIDKIVPYVVNYMGANQGALFLVNDDEGDEVAFLEMKGCYAYSRKEHISKKVNFGEGFVGQCYLEKDYLYMTQIPSDYVRITSD